MTSSHRDIHISETHTCETHDLLDTLDRLESLFEQRESDVLAFVPEEGRFDRLRREARALLERAPRQAPPRQAPPRQAPPRQASPRQAPLLGTLVGVKDALHVDGFPTRAGSRLPEAVLRGSEGPCVTALKAAGALILGKTVTTEFTYFAPGPTRNPHRASHTPGGSSSGSAAAVGAGLATVALGTQTIGSITRPAAYCGVVGFKASYDRVSRAGSIPLAPSLDHIGLLAKDVATVARVAPIITRNWQPARTARPIARPVLGIPVGPYLEHASPEGTRHFEEVRRRLEEAGYQVRSVAALEDFEEVRNRHQRIVAAECARVHAEWFPLYGELYQEKTSELIRRGQRISDQDLAEDLKGRGQLRRQLTARMEQQGVDLWISPSAQGPAPEGLDWTGDPVMNLPWTHCGFPTLGLPSGRGSNGLPLGLQLAGRWLMDEALLASAALIEQDLIEQDLIEQDLMRT